MARIDVACARGKPGSLARLVERLVPGGRLVRTRRLRGGVGARMDVLDIERADGTRTRVTLRRFTRENRSSRPEHVAHEYEVLRLLEKLDIPAPRPIALDAQGDILGVPAMALTYLPGRPVYRPRQVVRWAEQLAQALVRVHAVTSANADLSWLHVQLRDGVWEELDKRREFVQQHGALAREVHAALVDEIDHVEWSAGTLVHDDFWPGNTIWRSGRLIGVVDWTHAEVGDRRTDVSQCRIDLALIIDQAAADVFLAAYQAMAPQPLRQVWYFDLLRGLRALLSYGFWLEGYHDAGLTYVTPSYFRRSIRAFLRRALEERRRGAPNG